MDCMYDNRYERTSAKIIDICNECYGNIYEREMYYTFGTHNVCEDCIDDYVGQAKKEGV